MAEREPTLDDGSGVRLTWRSPVFMSVFYGPPTKERLEFLFQNEQRFVNDLAQFCAISVVDPRVGKEMPSDARQKAKEITEFFGSKMVCSVTIVEGTGFFPAMVRSVLAGVQLLSRRSGSALVVASTYAEAVQKLRAAAPDMTIDGPLIEQTLAELCAPVKKMSA